MGELIQSYKYRSKYSAMSLCFLVSAGMGLWLLYYAGINTKGMVIQRIITLSPPQATVALYVLGALCILGSLLPIFIIISTLKISHHIEIMSDGLVLPKRLWSTKTYHVKYSDIIELKKQEVAGQVFIVMSTAAGKFTIVKSMLPDKNDLDEILGHIIQNMGIKSSS